MLHLAKARIDLVLIVLSFFCHRECSRRIYKPSVFLSVEPALSGLSGLSEQSELNGKNLKFLAARALLLSNLVL